MKNMSIEAIFFMKNMYK